MSLSSPKLGPPLRGAPREGRDFHKATWKGEPKGPTFTSAKLSVGDFTEPLQGPYKTSLITPIDRQGNQRAKRIKNVPRVMWLGDQGEASIVEKGQEPPTVTRAPIIDSHGPWTRVSRLLAPGMESRSLTDSSARGQRAGLQPVLYAGARAAGVCSTAGRTRAGV